MKALCALAAVVAMGCGTNERGLGGAAPTIAPTSPFASTPVGIAFVYPPLASHHRSSTRAVQTRER